MANKKYQKHKALKILASLYGCGYVIASIITRNILFIIFGLIPLICLIILICYLDSAKHKGKVGERKVGKKLAKIAKKKNGFVINDIYIPDSNDPSKVSQIDHIILTRYFIAAIETKNYSGYLFGKDSDNNWTQVLAGGHTKNAFYSPVKQNQTHMYRLNDLLEFKHGVVDSYVCILGADISHLQSNIAFNLKGLYKHLKKQNIQKFSDKEVSWYKEILIRYKDNPIETKDEHIKKIKKMQNDVEHNVCPRCGGNLVLKTSKNGNKFYGCSNYPRCKFIKKY